VESVTSSAAADGSGSWSWDLPAHCPPPPVPADAPMSAAMVELGRHLFYDERLSGDGTLSCAGCHLQSHAFSDPRPISTGITGEVTRRNSMSLVGAGYVTHLTWAHPTLDRLEAQALIPLFGDFPIEMGAAGAEQEVLDRLAADVRYAQLTSAAFVEGGPLTWNRITRALATFQRSLVSCAAPYDRYIQGETDAMSESAARGMELFFSERTECFHCHGGVMFSDSSSHEGAIAAENAFHNTGLYNLDGSGAYPANDPGLMEFTENPADMGRFRAPSLRNIALTAPYMHDGSMGSLLGVITHYSAGGRTIPFGPNAGVGSDSPLKSEFVPGFLLTDDETNDLLAFLHALTDPTLATRAEWSNPWER
jgi:cytochrome c peroxidase